MICYLVFDGWLYTNYESISRFSVGKIISIYFIHPHDIADIQIIVWKQYIKFIIDWSVLSFSIGSLHFSFLNYEIIKSVFKLKANSKVLWLKVSFKINLFKVRNRRHEWSASAALIWITSHSAFCSQLHLGKLKVKKNLLFWLSKEIEKCIVGLVTSCTALITSRVLIPLKIWSRLDLAITFHLSDS